MTTDAYVFIHSPTAGGDLDASCLRGWTIADACARQRRQRGDDVLLAPALDAAARGQLDALAVAADWDRALAPGDAAAERWARWLIEKLEAAGRTRERDGGLSLSTTALHEESERRLGELSGWSDVAIGGQRELLRHVDAPVEDGDELEQSLSKLAAAGWKIEAKGAKAKKEPEVHFAAGDLPLAGADGAPHPRLVAALAPLLIALAPGERAEGLPDHPDLGRWLPAARTVAGPDSAAALLDMRTVAKALRDVGGLELPDGEPLGPLLLHGPLRFEGGAAAASSNGTVEAAAAAAERPLAELIDAHGADAVRFALLHAAAPAKAFDGGDDVVGYAAGFLAELRSFAAPRLDGAEAGARIDLDDGLRRRLAGWCDTAIGRVAENYERLELQRATRNAVALLARIQDFERRVVEHRGEAAGADRAAVSAALTVLVQLVAPIAPRIAGELWENTGQDGPVEAAGSPGLQREQATA